MILQNVYAYFSLFLFAKWSAKEKKLNGKERKREKTKKKIKCNLASCIAMCNGAYGPRPSKCIKCDMQCDRYSVYKYVQFYCYCVIWMCAYIYTIFRNTKLLASLYRQGIYMLFVTSNSHSISCNSFSLKCETEQKYEWKKKNWMGWLSTYHWCSSIWIRVQRWDKVV